jgi:hypothetical protein
MALPAPGFAHSTDLRASALDSRNDPGVGSQAEGVDTELEGTLEILHEDREDGSGVYHHILSTQDGKRVPLEGVQHPDLLTGDFVRVRGTSSGQKLLLKTKTAAALEVLQFAPLANTFGPKKTAVFLVNFADSPSYQPFTTGALKTFLDDTYSQFFSAASYGQASLVVDVFGWYTMPFINSGCPSGSIQYYAEQAAIASGIDLSGYTRRVYFFPPTACLWGGLGTIGGNPSHAWLNGSLGNFIHELGHNLGLYHSHFMSCAPEVLGASCTYSEYGDITDAMGAGGHFNPFQKARLGWLDYAASPPITRVQQSGTYTIGVYDLPGTTPKALKIQRGATAQAFFVALHRLVNFEYVAGVFVHLATDGAVDSSYLLDMTPETPDRQRDGYLDVGKSFTDPVSGITITTVSISPDGMSATIAVTIGGVPPSLPSTPTTLAGGPQLTWTAGTPITQTGFVVERAAGPLAAFAPIATTTAPNYLDTSGVAGQCYRVRATNAGGTSGPSNVACATTPLPSTPTALTGGPQLTWTAGTPATQTGFVVERAAGPTATFATIATTTVPNYLDTSGVAGQCYRVRATNAGGTSGPSNVACVTTPPVGATLTITTNSPIGREMTFGGTITGSTTLTATTDGIAIAAKYIVVDKTRKTWTVKATNLLKGPHTFAVASGSLTASRSFTVLK